MQLPPHDPCHWPELAYREPPDNDEEFEDEDEDEDEDGGYEEPPEEEGRPGVPIRRGRCIQTGPSGVVIEHVRSTAPGRLRLRRRARCLRAG
jgi:hypothetical protein